MALLKVLRHLLRRKLGFLLLCLIAITTKLIGQTKPYTIHVGSFPNALQSIRRLTRLMSSTLTGI